MKGHVKSNEIKLNSDSQWQTTTRGKHTHLLTSMWLTVV